MNLCICDHNIWQPKKIKRKFPTKPSAIHKEKLNKNRI